MRHLGKTQTEIAQVVGCNQATVSDWLRDTEDTTDLSRTYLAGQSLRMAKNIVRKGMARDHIQALNGLGVLNQPLTGGVTVNINGLSIHGLGSIQTETVDAEPLSPDSGK